MKAFQVKVRTATAFNAFIAIGISSAAVEEAIEDRLDEPYGIAVIPLDREQPCQ